MKNNLANKINSIMTMKELTISEKEKWVDWLKKADKQTKKLKQEFGDFYNIISKIIFNFNPIDVPRDKENNDKYQLEAEAILKKIKAVSSQQELNKIIVIIFIKSFFKEIIDRRIELYERMSEEIWKEWLKFSPKQEIKK